MSVTVTSVKNPLAPHDRMIEPFVFRGNRLADYLPAAHDLTGCIVFVNDKVFDGPDAFEITISDGDMVTVGGKIGYTLAGVVGNFLADYFAGAAAYGVIGGGYAYGAAYVAGYLATMFVVGYGLSQIMTALAPDVGYTDPESNAVYGWDPIHQTESEGNAIPEVCGAVRMGGQVINQFTRTYVVGTGNYTDVSIDSCEQSGNQYWFYLSNGETAGIPASYGLDCGATAEEVVEWIESVKGDVTPVENQDYLYMLLGAAGHEVDSITDIQINEQRTNYFDNVTGHVRLGTNNDEPIDGFGELVQPHSFEYKLECGSAVTYETDGNSVQKINLVLRFAGGLGYIKDDGSYAERSVSWTVEYKTLSSETWIPWSQDGSGVESYTAAQNTPITLTRSIDGLSADQYVVRITRLTEDPETYRDMADLYFIGLQEIVKEELIYPGIAKYAITALATNQLSNSAPTVTALVKCMSVPVYDEDLGEWTTRSKTNPAWLCYHILVNRGGIDHSRMIWEEFKAWAAYCDEDVSDEGDPEEKRFVVNIVFDSLGSLWDQVQRVAVLGRGVVIPRGSRFGVFVDKPETAVSHMFSMGNIKKETFSLQYLRKIDLANNVEITFVDPDRDYSTQVLSVHSSDYIDSATVSRKTSIQVKAAISRSQAIRMAAFTLNSNRLLTKVIELEADIDSFRCVLGDLVFFQHDILDYINGMGGRVKSAGNDNGSGNPYVQFDREFDFQPGKSYSVLVRLSDDTHVEKTIINPGTTTDTVAITAAWTVVPDEFDNLMMGLSASYKTPYRVTNISNAGDLRKRITLMEYVEAIYNDQDFILEDPHDDDDDIPLTQIQYATNVQLTERLTYGSQAGDFASIVNATWQSGTPNNDRVWGVWLQDITNETGFSDQFVASTGGVPAVGGIVTTPVLLGVSATLNYQIPSDMLTVGHTYRVYISPSDQGAVNTGTNTQIINIMGKLAPPGDVADLSLYWNAAPRELTFSWPKVSDIDVAGYEVRLGADWDAGEYLFTEPGTIRTIVVGPCNGSFKYGIRAVDTSGIYSSNTTYNSVEIDTAQVAIGISTPTGLSLSTGAEIAPDGTTQSYIFASWDDSALTADYFDHYELVVEDDALNKFSEYSVRGKASTTIYVLPNKAYNVQVRAVDQSGNSTALSPVETITSAKDTVAPSEVTGLGLTSLPSSILIEWDHGGEADLSHFDVYRGSTSTFSSASKVGSGVKDFTAKVSMFFDAPPDYSTYYYWVVAVDSSGNESLEVGPVSGSKTKITAIDIQPLSITVTEIADDSISTPKLRANAVTANEIAAGTITANEIAANTITASLIAANTITADELAANSVTAAEINVATLSAIAANVGTLTAGRIQDAGNDSYFDLTNNIFRLHTGSKQLLYFNGSQLVINTDMIFSDGIDDATLGNLAYIDTVGNAQITDVSGGKITTGIIQNAAGTFAIDLTNSTVKSTGAIDINGSSGIVKFNDSSGTTTYGNIAANSTNFLIQAVNSSPVLKLRHGSQAGSYMTMNSSGEIYFATAAGTDFKVYAGDDVYLDAGDDMFITFGDNLSFKGNATGDEIQFVPNGTDANGIWMLYDGSRTCFYPYANGTNYVGTPTREFDRMHANGFYDSGSLLSDTLDDLDIFRKIKPKKKDGKHLVHTESGSEYVDFRSLPEWMTNIQDIIDQVLKDCGDRIDEAYIRELLQDDDDIGAWIKRNISRFNDMTNGGLRQLDYVVDDVYEELNDIRLELQEIKKGIAA